MLFRDRPLGRFGNAYSSLARSLEVSSCFQPSSTVTGVTNGPDESVFVGTWEEQRDVGRSQYILKANSTFEVVDPDAPYGPEVGARGRWYAGGKLVYLRFHFEEPSDRDLVIWHIDDISPQHLQIHIAHHGFVHTLTRIVREPIRTS